MDDIDFLEDFLFGDDEAMQAFTRIIEHVRDIEEGGAKKKQSGEVLCLDVRQFIEIELLDTNVSLQITFPRTLFILQEYSGDVFV
jgi:hypothetical protein